MLRIFSSLTFLYGISIALLLVYGFFFYRAFAKGVANRRVFPVVFLMISIASLSFLWINIHAQLSLKTFSNLDHNFLQHDGFAVNKKIELGNSDTVNFNQNPYDRFIFSKQPGKVIVTSPYSEEPFYQKNGDQTRLLSV